MPVLSLRSASRALWCGLLLALMSLGGCSSLQSMLESTPRPSASLRDVSLKSLSLTKLGLQFEAEVTNPYDVDLPLLNLDYNLSSGQSRLLKGVANLQGTTIPAKKSKVVSLPAEVGLADVLKFAQGLRPGSSVPYVADVKLGVDAPAPGVGKIAVPMGRSGELKLPTIPGL